MVIRESLRCTIRRFRREDLTQVIDINMACLPEHYPAFFYLNLSESYPEAFLVAEIPEGKVVGYIMCRVEVGFSSFGMLEGFARKGHIISVAVLNDYRRMGVGSALVEGASDALKNLYNCGECYLEVRASNQPAIALYESLGFERVKRMRSYYRDGEDAYTMSKKL